MRRLDFPMHSSSAKCIRSPSSSAVACLCSRPAPSAALQRSECALPLCCCGCVGRGEILPGMPRDSSIAEKMKLAWILARRCVAAFPSSLLQFKITNSPSQTAANPHSALTAGCDMIRDRMCDGVQDVLLQLVVQQCVHKILEGAAFRSRSSARSKPSLQPIKATLHTCK